MILPLLAAFSVLGPILAGCLAVGRLWPDIPPALRSGLGTAVGLAFTGTLYFLSLLVFASTTISVVLTEGALWIVTAILLLTGRRRPGLQKEGEGAAGTYRIVFIYIMICAGAILFFSLDSWRHGGFDALLMWNLKARLIETSPTAPIATLFDPVFLGLHADYPLLLPSLIARGWQYTRTATPAIPMTIAALFTIATIGIAIGGVQWLTTKSQALLAGSILLATPFLFAHGASQSADIVICCFMTAAIVLYSGYDHQSSRPGLLFLAGMAAAAAACTKNEGILFLFALVLSRLALLVIRRSTSDLTRELLWFGGGASLGLITLAAFKLGLSVPNEIVGGMMNVGFLQTRIREVRVHLTILEGFRTALNFGQWSLNPMPIMALHMAISGGNSPFDKRKPAAGFMSVFVFLAMLAGYYVVYLISPDDVEAQVHGSLDRLLLQLWPTIVIGYSLLTPLHVSATRMDRRRVTARVALVVAVVSLFALLPRLTRPAENATPGKLEVELSRTQVASGDSYELRVRGIASPQVFISYSIDDKPMGEFPAYLGSDGKAEFRISPTTPKGKYRFLAVRAAESAQWTPFEAPAEITVQ